MSWEWDRKTTIAAGVGAALATAATAVGVLVGRRYWRGEGDLSAPAILGDRPAGPVGYSGNARNAGAEAMRDPPSEWSKVDQAVDESFPASDPATAPHID